MPPDQKRTAAPKDRHSQTTRVATTLHQESRVQPAADLIATVPPWQCPGPSVREVVALPFGLSAILEFRCEARQPNSCVNPCGECLAARQVAS